MQVKIFVKIEASNLVSLRQKCNVGKRPIFLINFSNSSTSHSATESKKNITLTLEI